MRITRFYTAITLCMCAIASYAHDVTVSRAGSLRTLLTDPENITTLNVYDTIDASDIYFIASLPDIERIDLSNATIVAYNGEPLKPLPVTHTEANTIPPYAFMGCPARSIILPSSITAIGTAAFAASPITEISIPATVTSIGADAFTASMLQSVVLPGNITITIGDRAFARCNNLITATLETPLTEIPDRLFDGCNLLESLTLPASISRIGDKAFQGTALTVIDLSGCRNLQSIGCWAFAQSPLLCTVILPESVNTIGRGAFMGDNSLTSLTLSNSLGQLPEFMLCGAGAMTSITIPAATDHIGTYAMANMNTLAHINAACPAMVPTLDNDVWHGLNCSEIALSVPSSLLQAYATAEQWKNFKIREASAIKNISADTAQPLKVTRNGNILTIQAPERISHMQMIDCAGKIVTETSPMTNSTQLDIGSLPHNIYIIVCRMADSYKSAVKVTI